MTLPTRHTQRPTASAVSLRHAYRQDTPGSPRPQYPFGFLLLERYCWCQQYLPEPRREAASGATCFQASAA
jgi:hypothetical protein